MDIPASNPVRALVVDDGRMNRRLAERMLKRLNCEVFIAEGMDEAAEILRHEPLDIVFSDIEMPGIDGAEVAPQLRSLARTFSPERGHLRLVAVSGDGLGSDPEAYRTVGFDDYVPKPISFDSLKTQLDAIANPMD